MIAYSKWRRFGHGPDDILGYSPYPGLRESDPATISASAESATQMRSPVAVVCRKCGAWLVVVHEYADDEHTLGALLVVREKNLDTARRVRIKPNLPFAPTGSSATLSPQQKSGSFHVPLDATTPASLPTWCPKHGQLSTLPTAALRADLARAQRTGTARTIHHN